MPPPDEESDENQQNDSVDQVMPQPDNAQVPQAQEQTQDQPPVWYYCSSSEAYYPNVTECPEGWAEISASE